MSRKATGTLELRPGSYWARFTKPADSGKKATRRWVRLGTLNPIDARNQTRALAAQIADGTYVWDAVAEPKAKPGLVSFKDYADLFLARKRDKTARDYRGVLKRYAMPSFAPHPLAVITKPMVRGLFERLAERELSARTIRNLRMILVQVFGAAVEDELMEFSPITKAVKVPERAETDTRPFVIPTDDELSAVADSPNVTNLEIKILSLASRVEGGMRTGDLTSWTWNMIDTAQFTTCLVPRAKTRHKRGPQKLAIPEVLRPWLQAWWKSVGSPTHGPVFPCTRGKRRGLARAAGGKTSFAAPLRVALFTAGVRRHACRGQAPKKKTPDGIAPCCAAFARDPLYNDTETSRRANFHSLRRAFASSLADAGVNVQHAMTLTGHTDAGVHLGYVNASEAMQQIPAAALPVIRPPVVDDSGLSGGGAGSSLAAISSDFAEEKRFELLVDLHPRRFSKSTDDAKRPGKPGQRRSRRPT